MKDTVVILINDYKVFVGDIYEGKIKQVKFKSQDYWELFDVNDLKDFLEYMNYPLAYKSFKGSDLKVYFNQPMTYDYLYEVKDQLSKAESLEIGNLETLILDIVKEEYEGRMPQVVGCLEKNYSIKESGEGFSIEVSEEEEEEPEVKVTVQQICESITQRQIPAQTVEKALNHYMLFSPATLVMEPPLGTKRRYLEVDHKLISCVQDGVQVEHEQEILTYEKTVHKLWGKKEQKLLIRKAPQTGKFMKVIESEENSWTKKDQLIGVIAPQEETREETMAWLKYHFKSI